MLSGAGQQPGKASVWCLIIIETNIVSRRPSHQNCYVDLFMLHIHIGIV